MKPGDQILYEKYLQDTLKEEARAAFQKKLAEDADFRREFELYQEMEGFVGERVEKGKALDVLREVGRERKEGEKEQKLNKPQRRNWLWLILGLGVLALVSFYLIEQYNKDRKHQELLASYEYPPNRGTRSLDISTTKLDSAIHYFDLRRMAESEALFLEILKIDSLHQDANRYMGHISFLKGEYDESLFFLKNITLDSFDASLLVVLKTVQ